MNHVAEALSRRFSIQRDSQALSRRISQAQRLELLRRNLWFAISEIEREAKVA